MGGVESRWAGEVKEGRFRRCGKLGGEASVPLGVVQTLEVGKCTFRRFGHVSNLDPFFGPLTHRIWTASRKNTVAPPGINSKSLPMSGCFGSIKECKGVHQKPNYQDPPVGVVNGHSTAKGH